MTDSKLSRLERGEGRDLTPYDLKKAAQLYGIGVIPLYVMAGYLDESDLSDYQLVLRFRDSLMKKKRQSIQRRSILLTKGRQVSDHDI